MRLHSAFPHPVILLFCVGIVGGMSWNLGTANLAFAATGSKIGPEIHAKFQRDRGVCVSIELKHDANSTASLMARCAAYSLAQDECLAKLPKGSYELRYRFRYSPIVAVQILDAAAFTVLERAKVVGRVLPDTTGTTSTLQSSEVIEAPAAHTLGITGAGRVVAVLDTGIERTHDDFAGSVIHEWHFMNEGVDQGPGANDTRGHGTLVSGIIASRGVVAGTGMAPGVDIVAIKVINQFGSGFFIDWAAGVEHVVDLHLADNGIEVDVINMSLQSHSLFTTECDSTQPALAMACQAAKEVGITVVTCAGNGSPVLGGSDIAITSPGCLSSTIAVASVPDNDPDHLSFFSHRNALVDIVSPGEQITSSGLRNSIGTDSGCSFAAPHVAAVACLIREVNPTFSPDVVSSILKLTGTDVFDTVTGITFPLVNARQAVEAVLGPDCNSNSVSDFIDVGVTGKALDCNGNGIPDECDIANGVSPDENQNDIPDDCSQDNPFNRGDSHGDGVINLGDALTILNYLFDGGEPLACRDAADANNDGRLDIADGISLLVYLFGGGLAPPTPGPPDTPCGFDSDDFGAPGNLGCRHYRACTSEP